MDLKTQLLEQGINYKRNRNFSGAIECYNAVINIDPYDARPYMNLSKVYFGSGNTYGALQAILQAAYINIIKEEYKADPFYKQIVLNNAKKFDNSPNVLCKEGNRELLISKNHIATRLESNKKYYDLIYRAENLTFYAGVYLLGMSKPVFDYHKIPIELLYNEQKKILGIPTSRNSLRGSLFESLVYNMGFFVISLNFLGFKFENIPSELDQLKSVRPRTRIDDLI